MKLLFADPNRDLLHGYEALLTKRGYAVCTVFDGTQAMTKLTEEDFSLVILNDALPRVPIETLLARCHESGAKVLLLASGRRLHASAAQADAVLAFPFLPTELYGALRVLNKEQSSKEAGETK